MTSPIDLGPTVAVAVVIVADGAPAVLVDADLGSPATIARAVLAARSAKAHADGIWCTPDLPDGLQVSARRAMRGDRPAMLVVTPGRETWNLVELAPVVDLRRWGRA